MKCMVRWENNRGWRGPFEVYEYGEDWVKLAVKDSYYPTVPRAWTLGIDDGWTIWEGGGACPVDGEKIIKVLFRNGTFPEYRGKVDNWYWDHRDRSGDVIAYRVVEEAPKTLDQAWDEEEPSLAVILDRTLWWVDDDKCLVAVDVYDPDDSEDRICTSGGVYVSRDWFTGRRHLTAEELAEEMEGRG